MLKKLAILLFIFIFSCSVDEKISIKLSDSFIDISISNEMETIIHLTDDIKPDVKEELIEDFDVEKPVITYSVKPGIYENPIETYFSVSHNKTEVVMYYSLDGTEPTESSPVYISGKALYPLDGSRFIVKNKLVFKALAVDEAGNKTYVSYKYLIEDL